MDNPANLWQQCLQKFRMGVKRAAPFVSGVLAAFLGLLIYNLVVVSSHQITPQDINQAVANAMASATPSPAFSEQVYQVIQPSLVLIQTTSSGAGKEVEYGLGTGVVIDIQGDILTSLHIVANTSNVKVTFADGTESDAQVITTQPERDIAVLQALDPPLALTPAILGNPNAMHVGDEAYVVGNPFGLYSSMSAGVISGFNRTFRPPNGARELQGMIQIDAAVNPGNSGGPLLNRYGYVVGIVTGLANPTEQNFFVGIGFAVPITDAVGGMGSPPY